VDRSVPSLLCDVTLLEPWGQLGQRGVGMAGNKHEGSMTNQIRNEGEKP